MKKQQFVNQLAEKYVEMQKENPENNKSLLEIAKLKQKEYLKQLTLKQHISDMRDVLIIQNFSNFSKGADSMMSDEFEFGYGKRKNWQEKIIIDSHHNVPSTSNNGKQSNSDAKNTKKSKMSMNLNFAFILA